MELCSATAQSVSEPQDDRTVLEILRSVEGLTKHQLADRAGVARHTIGRIEARQHRPRTMTMVRIAAALGYDVRRVFPEYSEQAGA